MIEPLYIGSSVEGLSVMMNTFGNQPELLKRDTKEHLKALSPSFKHLNITRHNNNSGKIQNHRKGGSEYGQGHQRSSIHYSSTETLANTTCHTFGIKFCLPSQNQKANKYTSAL